MSSATETDGTSGGARCTTLSASRASCGMDALIDGRLAATVPEKSARPSASNFKVDLPTPSISRTHEESCPSPKRRTSMNTESCAGSRRRLRTAVMAQLDAGTPNASHLIPAAGNSLSGGRSVSTSISSPGSCIARAEAISRSRARASFAVRTRMASFAPRFFSRSRNSAAFFPASPADIDGDVSRITASEPDELRHVSGVSAAHTSATSVKSSSQKLGGVRRRSRRRAAESDADGLGQRSSDPTDFGGLRRRKQYTAVSTAAVANPAAARGVARIIGVPPRFQRRRVRAPRQHGAIRRQGR